VLVLWLDMMMHCVFSILPPPFSRPVSVLDAQPREASAASLPLDVIVLLDTSGSMSADIQVDESRPDEYVKKVCACNGRLKS
jgi:hypothetical protein